MSNFKTYGLALALLGLLSAIACSDNDKLPADKDAGHDEDQHDGEEDAGDEQDSDSGGPDETMDAGEGETDAGAVDASNDAGQVSTAVSELGADLVFDPNELEAALRLPAEAEFPQDLLPPK